MMYRGEIKADEFASIPMTMIWGLHFVEYFITSCVVAGSQFHDHKVDSGGWAPLATMGLRSTSAVESNTHSLVGMAVALPSPHPGTPYLPCSLVYPLLGTHLTVPMLPSVGPNTAPCWIPECSNGRKPKPKHLAVRGSCWINYHPREQRPSKPNTRNNHLVTCICSFFFPFLGDIELYWLTCQWDG